MTQKKQILVFCADPNVARQTMEEQKIPRLRWRLISQKEHLAGLDPRKYETVHAGKITQNVEAAIRAYEIMKAQYGEEEE